MSRILILPASAALIVAILLAPLVLVACNAGEQTLFEADPNAAPTIPRYEDVVAIVERNCVPCHTGGGESCLPTDDDGESDPNYDNCRCLSMGFSLLLKVVAEDTMPPGAWPRLTEQQKLILHNWGEATKTEQASWPCSP